MELTHLSDIDVRALAEVSAEQDVFLTVYLPTASREDKEMNASFVRSRVGAIRDAISGDIEADFERTFAVVEELLFHDPVPGERGRVVFASAPLGFMETYRLGVAPERTLVLDNSPYILPLAEMMDEYEAYAIILMDSRHATLYLVEASSIEKVTTSSIDLMNRHKKGGMSQKRFNRLRRGQLEVFVDEVLDDLERMDTEGIRGLVLAGPGEAKGMLAAALPKHYADMVLGTLDVDIDVHPADLLAHADGLARADEVSDEQIAVENLRRAIFKDELAAVGLQEVRDALVQGRVATLLIEDDLSLRGWICESCKALAEGPGPCVQCGGTVSSAELVNELVEMAHRTDVAIQHVQVSPFLDSIGGVGAILRY